jgi:hypothetical protein
MMNQKRLTLAVIAGYRFSFALTVDDLIPLRGLRASPQAESH